MWNPLFLAQVTTPAGENEAEGAANTAADTADSVAETATKATENAAETSADVLSQGEQFLAMAKEFLATQGLSLAINIVAALAIFFIGKWVAGMIRKFVVRLCEKRNIDKLLATFLSNILYGLLMAFVILAAISRLGVNTTSFAAIIAAAGLAVGLALQDSLGNFASGVMLILFRPFKAGDLVDAGGSTGVIEEIQLFSTIMRTGDNVQIIVPNGSITGGTITNFSAKSTRRIDLVIGCGYGDNLKEVKEYLEQLLASDERILKDPAPVVAVSELGDSSVNFVVRPWVNAGAYWDVKWDLLEQIKNDFDAKGFNIPYPTQDIHVHQAESA